MYNYPDVFVVVSKYVSGMRLVATLRCAAQTFVEVS